VFGRLADVKKTWKIYGYSESPRTALNFPDTTVPGRYGEVVARFARFQEHATEGELANFSYIEPEWAKYPKNPPKFMKTKSITSTSRTTSTPSRTWRSARSSQALRNGPKWEKTLLIITYDEHGGTYDHVHPPTGAVRPDNIVGSPDFDFTRFGVRVPAVIVSPLIEQEAILRAPADGPPFDHTSIIATLRARFGIGALETATPWRQAWAPSSPWRQPGPTIP
jgi:phospholipase C